MVKTGGGGKNIGGGSVKTSCGDEEKGGEKCVLMHQCGGGNGGVL